MSNFPKLFTNPSKSNFKNIIFNNYKSFIKDNILKENITNREKKTKSYISLINNGQIKSLDNSLIGINSEKKIIKNNNDNLFNTFNHNKYRIRKSRKNNLSHNNFISKKLFSNNNESKIFNNLNNSKNIKNSINNYFSINNQLNLRNISNSYNSLSLLNETYFQSKNNDEIQNNKKQTCNSLKRKGFDDKNFLNSQSNIYKVEYIKKTIRKYYFENFDNLKDYYNYINIDNNNCLTIEHFIYFLKEILKVLIDKKELRHLLNANGIIKVDYLSFKYIFFPELTNNKLINLKLKNENNNLNDNNKTIKNNYSCNRKKDSKIERKENLPTIRTKIFSFKNIHNINMKILQKLKINQEINNLLNDVNKDFKYLSIENDFDNRNKKILTFNKNKYIDKIYKTLKEIQNSKKYDNSLLRINGIEIKKDTKEIQKTNFNNILINDKNTNKTINKKINEINTNDKAKIRDNKTETKKEIKNENKNNIIIKNNAETIIISDKNKKNKDNTIHFNTKKNNTINTESQYKKDLLLNYKNNAKLFFINKNNNNVNQFIPPNIKNETRNLEKNSDIIEFL